MNSYKKKNNIGVKIKAENKIRAMIELNFKSYSMNSHSISFDKFFQIQASLINEYQMYLNTLNLKQNQKDELINTMEREISRKLQILLQQDLVYI
jgi:hypothetical protein